MKDQCQNGQDWLSPWHLSDTAEIPNLLLREASPSKDYETETLTRKGTCPRTLNKSITKLGFKQRCVPSVSAFPFQKCSECAQGTQQRDRLPLPKHRALPQQICHSQQNPWFPIHPSLPLMQIFPWDGDRKMEAVLNIKEKRWLKTMYLLAGAGHRWGLLRTGHSCVTDCEPKRHWQRASWRMYLSPPSCPAIFQFLPDCKLTGGRDGNQHSLSS